ncbi:MAG: UDP-N-acetylglucosamine 2-epimerase (hydrolyzing) [Helicobacteraceae bacterium]|nr:UDP-N-acetylglucosamine 2-epimerase (hydrolyzing) [Helicobacteraceae bacterium]
MKKVLFLTGTRADFGKLKSLIKITQESKFFDVHIFATGMHLSTKYGHTVNEIYKSGFNNIFQYINHENGATMDKILSKTINGLSDFVLDLKPDLIVVHGDRVEALAGAIVGSLNNILVAHIEGGEVSGTIDELIRHSVSKLSHVHLVSNSEAKGRLIQMGEDTSSIFEIGSPDLDAMSKDNLSSLDSVLKYYNIPFKEYAIALFHPVTTNLSSIQQDTSFMIDAMLSSHENYIVVLPNNDTGSDLIVKEYEKLQNLNNIKIFPSVRFEYFLALLKNAKFIMGNSSAGIREAPYYHVPTINIGDRQHNRVRSNSIINVNCHKDDLKKAIKEALSMEINSCDIYFGDGDSDKKFYELLTSKTIWRINHQKQFKDLI